jgi:predicted DNA-binding antitoxin AbrB/MazE fold protein
MWKERMMVRTIRAKFSGGVFEPLEPAAAEMVREGQEVLITISTELAGVAGDPIRETAGAWKDLLDADALKRKIYADRLVGTRPDPTL